jgi:hypothetical protein
MFCCSPASGLEWQPVFCCLLGRWPSLLQQLFAAAACPVPSVKKITKVAAEPLQRLLQTPK